MTFSIKNLAVAIAAVLAVSSWTAASVSAQEVFRRVTVDGNTLVTDQAASVVYNSGVYHMWYRDVPIGGTDWASITTLKYASSGNGLNFSSAGSLSFSNDPFGTDTPPDLYYENVSLVDGEYKIQHFTYNGGANDFPEYNYNISISDAGATPSNSVEHLGPIAPQGNGVGGNSSSTFGIVGDYLYTSPGARTLRRLAYNDPLVTVPSPVSDAQVADFQTFFDGLGISDGYISNHSDVVSLGGDNLAFVFTVRENSGARFDQQLYASLSSDGGATWDDPIATLTSPTLAQGSFVGNFSHADVVMVNGSPIGYFNALDNNGDYIIATNAIPEPGSIALVGLAGMFGTAVYLRRRWA